MTTNLVEGAEPLRVRVPATAGLPRESDLLIDQLRAIDNRRLAQGPRAHLSSGLIQQVEEAIREMLELGEG